MPRKTSAKRTLSVSELLRHFRRARGLSQSEIAQRMGTLRPAVARLESPAYRGHSLSSLRDYAAACGFRLELRASRGKRRRVVRLA